MPKHKIVLARCSKCKLLQLFNNTNLEVQYDDYLYLTQVTNSLNEFYSKVTNNLMYRFSLSSKSFVVDLGSNDGSFLHHFLSRNVNVLGIDPSKPASKFANDKGIETWKSYFDADIAQKIIAKHGRADLVSINYTLANVPNIYDFLTNVKTILKKDGVLSIITGYHPDQFQVNMFDYIGHDHLSYFTLEDISNLAEQLGMKIIDVEKVEHKGGSLHILLSFLDSTYQVSSSVHQIKQREFWQSTQSNSSIFSMVQNIENSKSFVKKYIDNFHVEEIVGVGASISTTYFLNEYELNERVSILLDDDKRKIGMFSPGAGIEVKPIHKQSFIDKKILLLLAWQHTNKIIMRLKEEEYRGPILIPLPNPQIIHI